MRAIAFAVLSGPHFWRETSLILQCLRYSVFRLLFISCTTHRPSCRVAETKSPPKIVVTFGQCHKTPACRHTRPTHAEVSRQGGGRSITTSWNGGRTHSKCFRRALDMVVTWAISTPCLAPATYPLSFFALVVLSRDFPLLFAGYRVRQLFAVERTIVECHRH